MNKPVFIVKHFVTIKLMAALLALQLSGCGDAPNTAQHPPQTSDQARTSAASAPPRRYSWATAAGAPGCLPRLQAMMKWYETQADMLRQAEFIEGQPVDEGADDGPLPLPKGPFSVNEDEVASYLTTLSHSGYFSAHYIATLRARAQATGRALEHKQPPVDSMPNLADFPLFVLNDDDMMNQKGKFVFTGEQPGRVVILNDGDNLQQFTFDASCRIDAVSSTQVEESQLPVQ